MDLITQGALGAACAQAVLYKKDKQNAWFVGALAGMAADLDMLFGLAPNPITIFYYHRHFTHSLLFIPVGALLVTLVLLLFKRFRTNWKLTFLAALIGYATHGLLDALTNYGTLLFWPFSSRRVSLDVVSILDFFVTIPLIIGIIGTQQLKNRWPTFLALTFVSIFFIGNNIQHSRALDAILKEAKKQNFAPKKVRAFPQLGSSTQWRGLAVKRDTLLIYAIHTPLFKDTTITLQKKLPLFFPETLPNYIKNSPTLLDDFYIFNWFSDGYLVFVQRYPLLLTDGRFLMNNDLNKALWAIKFLPQKPYVEKLRQYNLNNPQDSQ